MAFQPAIDAVDAAGPEAQAARYEGAYASPHEALLRLVASRRTVGVAGRAL
jgi:hypothetical protein